MDKNKILDFLKENYKTIFFSIVGYQLFLCIITFSATNFRILMIELFVIASYIIIDNWRSKSKKG